MNGFASVNNGPYITDGQLSFENCKSSILIDWRLDWSLDCGEGEDIVFVSNKIPNTIKFIPTINRITIK
jgi:hypothetical protein